MASGTATITNYNLANLWLLKDRINCLLIESSESYIAEKISELIEDIELRKKIIKNGLKTVNRFDWEREMEKIWRFMTLKKERLKCQKFQ